MVGDARNNVMAGAAGNDNMNGVTGDDVICGGPGDDTIVGGEGNDPFLVGDFHPIAASCSGNSNIAGVDKIVGGAGDDRLFHSSTLPPGTSPDGKKDILDCGYGNDRAFINTSTDGDVAVNCEDVQAG